MGQYPHINSAYGYIHSPSASLYTHSLTQTMDQSGTTWASLYI